jgi:hypothetical protein
VLWALNTHSKVRHASSAHRMLCKGSSSTEDSLETDVRSVSTGMGGTDRREILR